MFNIQKVEIQDYSIKNHSCETVKELLQCALKLAHDEMTLQDIKNAFNTFYGTEMTQIAKDMRYRFDK